MSLRGREWSVTVNRSEMYSPTGETPSSVMNCEPVRALRRYTGLHPDFTDLKAAQVLVEATRLASTRLLMQDRVQRPEKIDRRQPHPHNLRSSKSCK